MHMSQLQIEPYLARKQTETFLWKKTCWKVNFFFNNSRTKGWCFYFSKIDLSERKFSRMDEIHYLRKKDIKFLTRFHYIEKWSSSSSPLVLFVYVSAVTLYIWKNHVWLIIIFTDNNVCLLEERKSSFLSSHIDRNRFVYFTIMTSL